MCATSRVVSLSELKGGSFICTRNQQLVISLKLSELTIGECSEFLIPDVRAGCYRVPVVDVDGVLQMSFSRRGQVDDCGIPVDLAMIG